MIKTTLFVGTVKSTKSLHIQCIVYVPDPSTILRRRQFPDLSATSILDDENVIAATCQVGMVCDTDVKYAEF